MNQRIACYTLFDITQTNVLNRSKPIGDDALWIQNRNTQANFDTIMQCISLRGTPDILQAPSNANFSKNQHYFGFLYHDLSPFWYWSFEFQVGNSVFDNSYDELGYLTLDCNEVPMMTSKTECTNLPSFLDTTPELKNIHFEVIK
jgi:hypothetical protein